MACEGRLSISYMFTGMVLATVLLSAGSDDSVGAAASAKKLVRNRRNISWYKQHSDFWSWYKYFTDTGNQDGVQQLDRVYLAYLQNKNRAEGHRSYKLYLNHLSDIYKSCAESGDPNCVASYTSRPKAKPEPPKPAPMKGCDPYRDPYCLYALGYSHDPYLAPAPVKAPAYVRTAPVKDPRSGYYYYVPVQQSFLSAEQKAELLRICDAKDVECLQYHLRAAYGYSAAAGPVPSYAHLGCDPKTDPNCVAPLAQKAPSGMHFRYPNCDPRTDPYCDYAAALHAAQNLEAPSAAPEAPCNPLFDDNCNPLTASKFANLAAAPEEPKDKLAPAGMRAPVDPRYDPYAMFRDAAAAAMHRRPPTHHRQSPPQFRQPPSQFRQPPPQFRQPPSQFRQPPPQFHQPQHHQPPQHEENPHPLGPRGKTKEGYECFIGYDEECFPLRAQNEPRSGAHRQTPYAAEAYEPHLNADGSRTGVVEPDPDCDPEYDSNCRLRRYEPEAAAPAAPHEEAPETQPEHRVHQEEPQHQGEPYPEQQPQAPGYEQQNYDPYMSGQEDPYAGFGPQEHGAPSFQDVLRGYGDHYPSQDDHRAYTGDYRKK